MQTHNPKPNLPALCMCRYKWGISTVAIVIIYLTRELYTPPPHLQLPMNLQVVHAVHWRPIMLALATSEGAGKPLSRNALPDLPRAPEPGP